MINQLRNENRVTGNGKKNISLVTRYSLLITLIVLSVFSLTSCGEQTTNTYYYYSPSWTLGGKIVYIFGLDSVRKDIIGSTIGSSYTESVMTMSADGTGESFQFDATSAPPFHLSASPTNEYVAYVGGLNSGLFNKIYIRNISPLSPHHGAEEVELVFYPGIKAFDWAPNGVGLVYCTTNEIKTRAWNDYTGATEQVVTAEAGLEFVSWKYGKNIAFTYSAGGVSHFSLINPESGARIDLPTLAFINKPQISPLNSNEVYGLADGKYCKVTIDQQSRLDIASAFSGNLPRISPSGEKVVYSKTGESSGIYTLDLASGVETKIK